LTAFLGAQKSSRRVIAKAIAKTSKDPGSFEWLIRSGLEQ